MTGKCPDFLTIIEKPDGSTPPKIHLWITEKTPPEMEIDGLSREKVTLDIRLDPTEVIKKAKDGASKRSKKKIRQHANKIASINTHAKAPSAEEDFRDIIRGIVDRTPHSKISISALGQRFSKIVQKRGFANKSEYFDSIGLPKNKSISKAIGEHFPDGEIAIDGKHVIRNRRD